MTSTLFPISLYEELLPKVVAVLELTPEGLTSQQAKQKLLQTVGQNVLYHLYVVTEGVKSDKCI